MTWRGPVHKYEMSEGDIAMYMRMANHLKLTNELISLIEMCLCH